MQATQSRLSSISAALDAARGEAAGLAAELDTERHRCSEAARAAARAEEQMRTSTGSAALLRDQLKQVRRPAGDSTRILSRLVAGLRACDRSLAQGLRPNPSSFPEVEPED